MGRTNKLFWNQRPLDSRLENLGYKVLNGPAIAAGELGAEQPNIRELVMPDRCQVGVWQS